MNPPKLHDVRIAVLLTLFACACPSLADQTETPPPKGYWQIPGTDTSLKVGGYVKADFLQDLDGANSLGIDRNSHVLDSAANSSSPKSRFSAQESRIYIKSQTSSDLFRKVETNFEGDWFVDLGTS